MCDVSCVDTQQASCTTTCGTPNGGLFCDGQFIDIGAVTDCNFALSVSTTADVSTHCAVSRGAGSSFGAGSGLVAALALGLGAARRRRRAS
jgi:hypothetical protein